MDVVYILGNGSQAQNEEMRYSVRSLEKYMLDLGQIFVVGENPKMLPGIKHIPASDTSPEKWKNAYYKTRKACECEEISNDFMLMNDDFFFLEPFSAQEWPFYAVENGNGGPCGPVDFGIHCPIVLKKEWYLAMPFDTAGKGPRSPRTMYANFYKAPPKYTKDFIVRAGPHAAPLEQQVKGRPCFSIGDAAMLDDFFMQWLYEQYPEPSSLE